VTEARLPTRPTLARYGLSAEEWLAKLAAQGGVCGICGKVPASGTLCVDHQHVRGWARMTPELRKTFVRGLLCFACNTALRHRVTTTWLTAALDYMTKYDRAKGAA
jgi:hypothetical protein